MAVAEWVAPTVTILGGVVAAWITGKFAFRASDSKVTVDKELGSGALALQIAERLDGEVKDMRRTLADVRLAWRQHLKWDDAVIDELETLDPGASRRLPERPELPF
jgi:hypothetical protein